MTGHEINSTLIPDSRYLRKLEPRIFSYLPTELYADVFAMGTVDEFCGGADGGAVVIMGVGEVDEQGEW